MYNSIKQITLVGLLTGIAAISFAGDGKLYVDVGAGYAAPENMPNSVDFSLLHGVTVTSTPTQTNQNYGGRAVVGMLWDTDTPVAYGAEVGAAYYGTTKYSTEVSSVSMHYYGIEFLGVAQFNFDKLHLILKGGGTDEQLQPAKDNMEDSNLEDSSTILPEVGVGLAYSFTPNLQIGLSYYHTFGEDVTFDSNSDAENLPSINMGLLEFSYFFS